MWRNTPNGRCNEHGVRLTARVTRKYEEALRHLLGASAPKVHSLVQVVPLTT